MLLSYFVLTRSQVYQSLVAAKPKDGDKTVVVHECANASIRKMTKWLRALQSTFGPFRKHSEVLKVPEVPEGLRVLPEAMSFPSRSPSDTFGRAQSALKSPRS